MSGHESFDDALDAAIDAMARGEALQHVLAAHPTHARELLPSLAYLGGELRDPVRAPLASARLETNFRAVRAAVHRAEPAQSQAPWWRRPMSFASLSLPAGIFALVAIGGAAAAGGAVGAAATTDLPAKVQQAVPLDFARRHEPAPAMPTVTPAAPRASLPAATDLRPGGDGATSRDASDPVRISVAGYVSGLTASAFRLEADDGVWNVTLGTSTAVTGTLADGDVVKVTGDALAHTLRAVSVEVTGISRDAGSEHDPAAQQPGGHDEATSEPDDEREQPASSTPASHDGSPTPEPTERPDEHESTELPEATEPPGDEHDSAY